MTQKDKDLLFNDLCARLPYGVKCDRLGRARRLLGIDFNNLYSIILDRGCYMPQYYMVEDIKPYLRPMSSMTEEEKEEFDDFCVIDEFVWKGNSEIGYKNQAIIMSDAIDWLNKNHFDYRGLIEKGLAIKVTSENNPYNTK